MAKGTENSRQLSSRDPHPQTFPLSHLLSHWQTCWVHTMWQACPRCCGHRSHQWEGTPVLRWCSREQNAVWGRAAVWRKHGRGVRNTRILEVCSLVFRNSKDQGGRSCEIRRCQEKGMQTEGLCIASLEPRRPSIAPKQPVLCDFLPERPIHLTFVLVDITDRRVQIPSSFFILLVLNMYLLRGQDVYTWVQVPMDTRASDPVKWQAVVSHPVWALGTKPRSSASRAHALNHQGFSLKNNEMLSGVLPLPPYPECTWASIDAAGMVGEGPSGQT